MTPPKECVPRGGRRWRRFGVERAEVGADGDIAVLAASNPMPVASSAPRPIRYWTGSKPNSPRWPGPLPGEIPGATGMLLPRTPSRRELVEMGRVWAVSSSVLPSGFLWQTTQARRPRRCTIFDSFFCNSGLMSEWMSMADFVSWELRNVAQSYQASRYRQRPEWTAERPASLSAADGTVMGRETCRISGPKLINFQVLGVTPQSSYLNPQIPSCSSTIQPARYFDQRRNLRSRSSTRSPRDWKSARAEVLADAELWAERRRCAGRESTAGRRLPLPARPPSGEVRQKTQGRPERARPG